jgi:triosephosphate isomerase
MAGTGKFVVGGNWKCNGNTASITQLVKDLNKGEIDADVDVIVAPPMLYLPKVQSPIDRQFKLSAQNCWVSEGGAFTGEVSAEMLADANVPWVILGHSERRALCGESDEFVGKKVAYAIKNGLSVMACIGETLQERESGATQDVCRRQLQAIVNELSAGDWEKVVIAYEPVWAIGTGKVATPEQAQETHAGIRAFMASAVSQDVASKVRIQYGGSVNAGNCEELAKQEDIDGFLVGGASLIGDAFITICNSAKYNTY